MKKHKLYFILSWTTCVFLLVQCKNELTQDAHKSNQNKSDEKHQEVTPNHLLETKPVENPANENIETKEDNPEIKVKKADSEFIELTEDEGIALEIRYATKNNFTKQKIYDCARCYLRPVAAENLLKAQSELLEKYGYSFKIFDCFRPRPYQQRLWDVVPDDKYVTPPAKGSMHSRGLAVDLTLVDEHGNELDMGTPYDYFGEEAHYSYNHPNAVKRNRWILKSTMEKYGFGGIRTEWWHFSYRKTSYPLDEWVWECK